MKFGIFYEHQLPRPWDEESELRLFQESLDQVELADQLGIDAVWAVEHHFLEEYAHGSAPEVFLAACSQRTKNIRLGHGIMLMPAGYNHPFRAVERIATLDLVSGGRAEWGTGESNSALETGGFGVDPDSKKDMWFEATEQAANMAALSPYPGYEGKFFTAPCRNVVPKPVQKPHPPMWMACSRRESIQNAAEMGVGALAFGFFEPEQAAPWVKEYYDIIKSDRCVPVGHTGNANIAIISGFSCHQDAAVAEARGLDGFHFFGYGIGHYYVFGEHRPGHTNVWEKYEAARENIKQDKGRGCIGTPDQLRDHLRRYEDAGMDQIIFIQQGGKNQHDHICESLELFAAEVMPEFKQRTAEREAQKQAELAPYIEAALARKDWMTVPAEEDLPLIPALPKQRKSLEEGAKSIEGMYTDRTRDGSIFVPGEDPAQQRQRAGGDD